MLYWPFFIGYGPQEYEKRNDNLITNDIDGLIFYDVQLLG